MLHRHPLTAISAAVGVFLAATSHATPLALTTGLFVSMASGTTAVLSLSATNLPGGAGDITNFNGFGLALQLIPQAGATGSLQFAGFSLPLADGILPDPGEPGFELDGITNMAPVNGSTTATPIDLFMDETVAQQAATVPQGVPRNLGLLQIVSSVNAAGTWTLYAVNDDINRSLWYSPSGDETPFDQLPAVDGTALTLGTVSIVPEPSAIVFAVAAGGMLAIVARSRRSVG